MFRSHVLSLPRRISSRRSAALWPPSQTKTTFASSRVVAALYPSSSDPSPFSESALHRRACSAGFRSSLQRRNFSDEAGQARAKERTHDKDQADARKAVLEAALLHVPLHGWTLQAITAGAQDLGYSSMVHGMFPNGAYDLVDYVATRNLRLMSDHIQSLPTANLTPLEILRLAMKKRLSLVIPFMARWSEAIGVSVQVVHVPATLESIALLADEMWHLAGDSAVDTSWYTKRAALASVYSAAELYMLTDQSADYCNTWAFVDRRLEDVACVANLQTEVGAKGGTFARIGAGALQDLMSVVRGAATSASASPGSPFGTVASAAARAGEATQKAAQDAAAAAVNQTLSTMFNNNNNNNKTANANANNTAGNNTDNSNNTDATTTNNSNNGAATNPTSTTTTTTSKDIPQG